ncbi:unnamed protein product [Amoebophrya sp. A25]|nr:unnamed protein product [Amoebophrya sp. A25]|eukprot:GSA25T00023934001.1
MPSPAFAFAELIGSVICYGVMYAPARKYRQTDGVIFQFIMSLGILGGGVVLQAAVTLWYNSVDPGCSSLDVPHQGQHADQPGAQSSTFLSASSASGPPPFPLLPLTSTTSSSCSAPMRHLFFIVPSGVLGGFFWSVSNLCVLVSVKLLGLGVGFTLYHAINLLIGYGTGRFGWFGIPREERTTVQDVAQLVNVVAFVLIVFVETTSTEAERRLSQQSGGLPSPAASQTTDTEHACRIPVHEGTKGKGTTTSPLLSPASQGNVGLKKEDAKTRSAKDHGSCTSGVELTNKSKIMKTTGTPGASASTFSSSAPSSSASAITSLPARSSASSSLSTTSRDHTDSDTRDRRVVRKTLGAGIGILAGLFCGVNQVPFSLWNHRNPEIPVHLFTLSQALGITLTGTIAMLCYYLLLTYVAPDPGMGKVLGLVKPSQLSKVPPIQVAVVPGLLWVSGFFLSLDGVAEFGLGVGYVLTAVGPVAVSGLVATLVFDEIQGTHAKAYFWTAIALMTCSQIALVAGGS